MQVSLLNIKNIICFIKLCSETAIYQTEFQLRLLLSDLDKAERRERSRLEPNVLPSVPAAIKAGKPVCCSVSGEQIPLGIHINPC
jgi:hypothetical protein